MNDDFYAQLIWMFVFVGGFTAILIAAGIVYQFYLRAEFREFVRLMRSKEKWASIMQTPDTK